MQEPNKTKIFGSAEELNQYIKSIENSNGSDFEPIDMSSINTENMTRAERRRIEKSIQKIMKKKSPVVI